MVPEQRMKPRRQFIRPIPLLEDLSTVTPPETPVPGSQGSHLAEYVVEQSTMPMQRVVTDAQPWQSSPSEPDLRAWFVPSQPTQPQQQIAQVLQPGHSQHQTSQRLRAHPKKQLSQSSLPIPMHSGKRQRNKSRRKRLPFWAAACSIVVVIAVLLTQGNGTLGAWAADTLRSVIGPTLTAQVESWYLGLTNTTRQLQYQVGNKQLQAPWKVATVTSTPRAKPPRDNKKASYSPMMLNSITPLITPALAGEGTWAVQEMASGPYSYVPLDAKAFVRPDPANPYSIVTLLQFDTRFMRLHITGGTQEPGGPRGVYGPGIIPAVDQKGNNLLAAFNGGFKYADGQYGLKADGKVYVPPQPKVATIAITKEGKIILGAWGVDPDLNAQNTNIVAWRQNAALLINNGVINPLTEDGAAWGGTILNKAYTWRSGIGVTSQGTLLYAAGDFLTAKTLGEALRAAGAIMAMQTDINPFWVRAFLYSRGANGQISVGKLNPQMQGTGYEYINGTQRDFFYLTRFVPPPPPPGDRPQETEAS